MVECPPYKRVVGSSNLSVATNSMPGKVVHCKRERYDVYIGRKANARYSFGNPFTHLDYGLGALRVKTRQESIDRFGTWLAGTTDTDVLQERRQWILDHLHELKDKVLGCYCAPLACHGDVLVKLANSV